MTSQDIRWQQRFSNFKKALHQLERFILRGELNEFEEQGMIQAFEYTYELAWKTLQDFLKDAGFQQIAGPKTVIEQSFQNGYIDGKAWVRMHQSRNLAVHTYNEDVSKKIIQGIYEEYFQALKDLRSFLEQEELKISPLFSKDP